MAAINTIIFDLGNVLLTGARCMCTGIILIQKKKRIFF